MQTRDATVLSQSLETGGPLPEADAVALFRQLLGEVCRLHQAGRIHRAIRPEAVLVDPEGKVTLGEAAPLVEFLGPDADRDACPPEVQPREPLLLPADAAAASTVLKDAGLDVRPERFDIYQLGVLFLRMLTGQNVDAFLRSPRVKGNVPEGCLGAILGALGFAQAERIADVSELAAALDAPVSNSSAETPPRGSAVALPSQAASDHGDTPLPVAPADVSPRESQPPPARLGHYRILSRIGQGGMGDVYLGFEEELQRQVAIKVLPVELARSEDLVRRFLAEATAVAQIAHPHVVPIYFIGHDAGRHFYAMQYVEGESLDRLLARQRRLPAAQTLAIVQQCLAGLQAVHQAGQIHRDIKPANILIDARTQRALVADFGLVKAGAGGPTATGVVLGTVDYMAPEIARGQKADPRCDLYAVGVMAYQMLSGRLPFVAETPTAVLFQHAYEKPPPLRAVAPDVPLSVADFVDRLMAKDPDDRYADCAAALIALRRCGKESSTESFPAVRSVQPLDDSLLDLPLFAGSAPRTWWERTRDHVVELVSGRRRPRPFIGSATVQDVDRAVAECEERRDRLAGLLADAQSAARALAAPSPTDDSGLAPESASRTVADLETDIAELRSQLADADATLAKLRGQRDLFKARLQAAGGSSASPRLPIPPRPLLIGAAVLTVALIVILSISRPRIENGPVAKVPDPTPPGVVGDKPLPVENPPELPVTVLLPPPLKGAVPTPEEAPENHAAALAVVNMNGMADVVPVIGDTAPTKSVGQVKEFAFVKQPYFLTRVQINRPHVTDESLRIFAGKRLRAVETVSLNGTTITGPGLRHVAQSMPYLRFAHFNNSPITDVGLAELSGLRELRELSLASTRVTDGGMDVLRQFPDLYSLNLKDTAVTSVPFLSLDTLRKLSQFQAPPAFDDSAMPFLTTKSLKTLDLSKTRVTDAGLANLRPYPFFTSLILDGTAITDAGMDSVNNIRSLTVLSLENTQVTAAGLAKLKDLVKLGRLQLSGTSIGDEGLIHVKEFKMMQLLYLENTKVTSDGLQHLAELNKLVSINLRGTAIDDRGLEHLANIQSLRHLVLDGTNVTNAGIMKLKATLKGLTIQKQAPQASVDTLPTWRWPRPSYSVSFSEDGATTGRFRCRTTEPYTVPVKS